MAIQLGQAYVAIHADGAGFTKEVTAQVDDALAQANAAATAGLTELESKVASTATAVEEGASAAAAGVERIGLAASTAAGEVGVSMREAAGSIGGIDVAAGRADEAIISVGAASKTAAAEVAGSSARAAAAVDKMGASSAEAAKHSGALGMSWKSIGEFAGGAAVYEAVKQAGDFQANVVKLSTTAGELPANLKAVGDGMLKMAGQTGVGANELATGMYIVESSMSPAEKGAKRAADALQILKAAAEGARQEGSSLTPVVDAVTTSLHDYNLPASDAANVTSQLIAAVSHGKTTFEDLTGALHSVEPRAAAANMTLGQTAATLSALTASGMHSDQAAQNLAHTLSNFEKPTRPMIEALANVGLNAQDLSTHLGERGVAGTLQLISDAIMKKMDPATRQVLLPALQANKVALKDLGVMMGAMPADVAKMSQSLLTGGTSISDYTKYAKSLGGQSGVLATQFLAAYKNTDGFNQSLKSGGPQLMNYLGVLGATVGTSDALNVALQLTGEHTKDVNAAIADTSKATAQADGNIRGWSEVQGNFNQKMAQAKAAVGAWAISVGTSLLPLLGQLAGWVTSTGIPALTIFGHWLGQLAQSAPVTAALHGILDVGKGVVAVFSALAPLVGTVANLFGKLPGPVQTVVAALVALKVASAIGLFNGITSGEGPASSALGRIAQRAMLFGQTYKMQMALADESTGLVTKGAGSLAAAFDAAMPGISGRVSAMAASVQASMAEVSGAFLEAKTAAATMTAQTLGAEAVSVATGDMAGLSAAAGQAAKALGGGLMSAGKGLMGMMGGGLGVAMIGATVLISMYQSAVQKATDTEHRWTDAMKTGGSALREAQAEMAQAKAKQDALTNSVMGGTITGKGFMGFLGQLIPGMGLARLGYKDTTASVDQATKAYNKWYDSLAGSDKAQADVTKAMNDYKDAAKQYGPSSAQAQAAGERLRQANESLATSQTQENNAQKTHLQLLQDQASLELGSVNSTLAAQQANVSLQQTIDSLNKGMADGTLKGNDLKQAQLGVATSALQAAQAAGQAAADQAKATGATDTQTISNAAQLKSLQDVAKQMGVNTPQAIRDGIAALQKGAGAADVTTAAMDALGQSVRLVPGAKNVVITAPTEEQRQRLLNLGFTVTNIPGSKNVVVTANTDQARTVIYDLVNSHPVMTIYTQVANGVHIGGGGAAGGTSLAGAIGGVVHAYAGGGMELNPMKGGIAQFVSPNTWRVIGDRVTDDEAYIPVNKDPRSAAIWAETGHRMGLLAGRNAQAGAGRSVHVTYAPQYTLPQQASAELVGALVSKNLVRDLNLGLGEAKLGF